MKALLLKLFRRALTFRSLELSLRKYYYAQVYGQLCAVAYTHYLRNDAEIVYAEIAEMARHMVEAGIAQVQELED